jgi:hypothetical protein
MPCPASKLGVIVPFVTLLKFRARHFEAACFVDVTGVLVARSGTACRALLSKKSKGKRAGRMPALQGNDVVMSAKTGRIAAQ